MPLREEWTDGGVLALTLDRPESYNAIDVDLRDALLAAFERADTEGAHCVVLRGAGRGFCAGMDLRAGGGLRGVETTRTMRRSAARLAEAVITCPVPLVVAVHGVCAGLGLTFALAADICVAAADARFVPAFIHRALVPDGGTTYLLPRLVGAATARRILLLGEEVPAPEAAALGMIAEVVLAADLDEVAGRRARTLAELPHETLVHTKAPLNRSLDIDLPTALFAERVGQGLMSTTPDYAEAMTAFREHRPPSFRRSVTRLT